MHRSRVTIYDLCSIKTYLSKSRIKYQLFRREDTPNAIYVYNFLLSLYKFIKIVLGI